MPVYENGGKPVVFDQAGMMERLMEDKELARKLTEAFLEDIPKRLNTLRQFIEQGDVKGAERLTHTIKGASASVGGDAFTSLAALMEKDARGGDLSAVKDRMNDLEFEFRRLKQVMEKEL